jgi:hypothetical protein
VLVERSFPGCANGSALERRVRMAWRRQQPASVTALFTLMAYRQHHDS